MNFEHCFSQQLSLHPSIRPRDVIKLCYQAAFGAEHLLTDLSAAEKYFRGEYDSVAADASAPLFENISPEICRVNLAAWKASNLPCMWLFHVCSQHVPRR